MDYVETHDMDILDEYILIDPFLIKAIVIHVFLNNIFIYENYYDIDGDYENGIPLGMPHQIQFLTNICQTIVDSGCVYTLHIYILKNNQDP